MDESALRCYIDENGVNVINAWLLQLDDELRGQVFGVLQVLGYATMKQWAGSLYKGLEKRRDSKCYGLGEIRIEGKRESNGDKYCIRILGFVGPKDTDFTMLYPFDKEIDDHYGDPCDEATDRKASVEQNWKRSLEYELP